MSISCNRNVLVVKDHVSSLSMPEGHTAPRRNFSRRRIGGAARPSPAGTREIAAIQRFSLVSSCQSKNETLNVAHLVRYQNLEGRPVERIRRGRKGLIEPMIQSHFPRTRKSQIVAKKATDLIEDQPSLILDQLTRNQTC